MPLDTPNILNLINNGESLTVEFKSEKKNQLSDHEIYENIVCMANGRGGVLLIGVENDGVITGSRQRNPSLLQAAIFDNTVPPINTRVAIHTIEEKQVVAVEVDPYPQVCSTKDGKCLRRIMGSQGPECRPFYPI